MKVLLSTIFAAVESSFIDLPALKSWADQCIEATSKPCDWIVDLSLASSDENALDVVRRVLPRFGVMLDENYGKLLLGFWYLRMASHDVAESDFLTECMDVIDSYEIFELDGSEIIDGRLSDSMKESLETWANESQNAMRRLVELRFTGEEAAAIGN